MRRCPRRPSVPSPRCRRVPGSAGETVSAGGDERAGGTREVAVTGVDEIRLHGGGDGGEPKFERAISGVTG